MPRTLNLKKVLSTEFRDSGTIGGDPQIDVEITCRRGASPEFSELIRVVIPIEVWINMHRTIESYINRQIARAEFLKGLMK